MPKHAWIKKVLVLGSGAIRIGQAGEFDYSGSQCLKAIREEGIDTVLINPNIATIQTDPRLAGKVYLLPVTPEIVEEVIKKEKPNAIMLAFGGQTGLNVGVKLQELGILEKYNVKVIGTPVSAIMETEDRELFRQAMHRSGVRVAKSKIATTLEDAIDIAKNEIGYPIIVRVAYTLGGKGSGIAYKEEELKQIVGSGLAVSMIHQVLIEEYLERPYWKEIEYEIVRDYDDNCITVCNMENFDPMGIHTGDSVVVAPCQTLTNKEVHVLREASIKVIRDLGIIGECNIQYALNAKTTGGVNFVAIEINARLSRSSALASKATGYPLAYIAAKLALGYSLLELKNQITNVTTACFEPALDYLVVKIPRWDLQKFGNVSRRIGTSMKSVGEIMAIGRNFEETFQKGIRMLNIAKVGAVCNDNPNYSKEELIDMMKNPTDERFLFIPDALKAGISIDELYQITGIDKWFLYKIQNIIDIENQLKSLNLISEISILHKNIKKAKKYGFSDIQIAKCLKTDEITIRRLRNKINLVPVIKQIDTMAAEWPAQTNYLYATYGGREDDLVFTNIKDDGKVIVLGSGTYRIGSSVEFDWGTVNIAWAFKKLGMREVILINYNPETVSTDYDMSDKLYFEEISFERVLDIYEKEFPRGIVVSVGGQVSNNLAPKLAGLKDYFRIGKVNVIGTEGRDIDRAENRSKFSNLLDRLGIGQPKWSQLTTKEDAIKFSEDVGYPILVRPSYVLSGAAMRVAYSKDQLTEYLDLAAMVSKEYPVVISKYMEDAREVDVDGICDGNDVFIGGVMEHVENAGVHSGDATMTIPPLSIPITINNKIRKNTKEIARALKIKGPFNIQFLVKDDKVYVIECNLRSSRSMPFVSKTKGVNLMTLAASVMMGKTLKEVTGHHDKPPSGIDYWGVKVPMFSFMRLHGADPLLGVEMASTGEAACYGESFHEALVKGLMATDLMLPREKGSILITVGGVLLKQQILPLVQKLTELNYEIYATDHTAEIFKKYDIPVTILHKLSEDKEPNIKDYIVDQKLDLIINIPTTKNVEKYLKVINDEYDIRRMAIEFNIPVLTNFQLAEAFVNAIEKIKVENFSITSLNEYLERLDWKFGF